ncbi:MAG: hypothetical protein IPM92_08255 [Saprospiraceae bacterium]|nr:hypothetical protein [Saprospiraceae bacterium]
MYKLALSISILVLFHQSSKPNTYIEWGFYGHRLINRLAVFTLPPELIGFYKKHIEYISEHAIDPDKRRYTVKAEAIRHYIDLDHWLHNSMDSLPDDYALAMLQFSDFIVYTTHDSFPLFTETDHQQDSSNHLQFSEPVVAYFSPNECILTVVQFRKIFNSYLLPEYDPDLWTTDLHIFNEYLDIKPGHARLLIKDTFSQHGILPYNFKKVYQQLVRAFSEKEISKILRLSAEIGHYLGDAHVPLHTSKNYNGQLTDQIGIHAFWESRIPELFAEQDFDFVVGPANYIDDVNSYIWRLIYESHSFVAGLLEKEKQLSQSYPFDKQYCFESRGSATVKLPCKKYAALYYQSLNDQVEQRMRKSIQGLGSLWLSAWIEAGQPDLINLSTKPIITDLTEVIDSNSKELIDPVRNHE